MITRWWDRGRHDPAHRRTAGNLELTSLTGTMLVPLLVLVLLTGFAMDAYWHVHYVIGFVLIPVVALKLASTGYRAISYYAGRRSYREAGPPELSLRLLAPVLVISTVVALGTGVALWARHSRSGTLSTLHTDSSVICALMVGIHLLAYVPQALSGSLHAMRSVRSRIGGMRLAVVITLLILGIGLSIVTYNNGTWPARERRPAGEPRDTLLTPGAEADETGAALPVPHALGPVPYIASLLAVLPRPTGH